MKKSIFAVMFSLFFVVASVFTTSAAGLEQEAVYDLQKGGKQEFQLLDKNGEICYVVIEKMEMTARIADDTYKVSFSAPGSWIAGFYVRIVSNQIMSVYSPFYNTIVGTIQNPSLTRNSNTEANYKFTYKNIISSNTGVRARISGTELKVGKI